jgi:hypothetical protein
MDASRNLSPGWWNPVLAVLGFTAAVNGVLMILFSAPWYECIINPARLTLFNRHFVIDVGGAYLTFGGAMLWTIRRPAIARPVLALSLGWYGLHALNHLAEYAAGNLPSRHWSIEVFAIFVPTFLLALLLRHAPRTERG